MGILEALILTPILMGLIFGTHFIYSMIYFIWSHKEEFNETAPKLIKGKPCNPDSREYLARYMPK